MIRIAARTDLLVALFDSGASFKFYQTRPSFTELCLGTVHPVHPAFLKFSEFVYEFIFQLIIFSRVFQWPRCRDAINNIVRSAFGCVAVRRSFKRLLKIDSCTMASCVVHPRTLYSAGVGASNTIITAGGAVYLVFI